MQKLKMDSKKIVVVAAGTNKLPCTLHTHTQPFFQRTTRQIKNYNFKSIFPVSSAYTNTIYPINKIFKFKNSNTIKYRR